MNVWSESSSSSSEWEEDGDDGWDGEEGAVEGDDGAVVSSSSSAVASESDDGGSFRFRWEAPPPEVAPEWDGDGAARPSMRGRGGGSRSFGGLGFWWRSGSGKLPRRSADRGEEEERRTIQIGRAHV